MSEERILVVAAHPDDEVLGCGGTVAKFRKAGHAVRVAFLAEGITARYNPDQFDLPDVKAKVERRNANARRALAVLGVDGKEVFTSLRRCCRLDEYPIIEIAKDIEKHLGDFKPTRLFTHAPNDANNDHRIVHRATLIAARPLPGVTLRAIYAYEVLSSSEWNPLQPFAPTVFHDITPFIEAKVSALAAYEDEMRPAPHPRSPDVLRALATYRGTQMGAAFAEGFMLVRGIDL